MLSEKQKLFMMGNRVGKSSLGWLRQTAWDDTGDYPSWYTGPRKCTPFDVAKRRESWEALEKVLKDFDDSYEV